MKYTELISRDHVTLRRGLDILDRMIGKLEDGERIEIADVTAIVKFLTFFGDEYHQRTVVAEIEAALNARKGRVFADSSRRLILLLRNHLDNEDKVLPDIAEQGETLVDFTRLEWKYMRKPQGTPSHSKLEVQGRTGQVHTHH